MLEKCLTLFFLIFFPIPEAVEGGRGGGGGGYFRYRYEDGGGGGILRSLTVVGVLGKQQ